MAVSGGGEPEPPAVEIVKPDGSRVPAGPPRAGRLPSTLMRFGAVLAAVVLFAFGVVIGRGTITSQFGTALPATTNAPSTATAGAASASSTAPAKTSPAESAPAATATSAPISPCRRTRFAPAWWAAATGCGSPCRRQAPTASPRFL